MARSEFEFGDQDYGSCIGWDPDKAARDERSAKARKKSPRSFTELPQMLLVRPIQSFVEDGSSAGELEHLYGPMWLEGELAVMYGMPGTGKSVLALQIAESIARGVKLKPYNNDANSRRKPHPKKVVYLDFELTRDQLALRYSVKVGRKLVDQYQFSESLFRTEMYWNGDVADGYEDFTDMLFENIRGVVDELGARILIVDNISFLTRRSTSSPIVAFGLMERLQQIKKERFLSILVVAHTPKHPDTKPLSDIDLQGSIDLAKVTDSMFVVGRSRVGPEYFYVKHIKSRTGIKFNSGENVAVFRIAKRDFASDLGLESMGHANFLGAEFVAFETEAEHVSFRFKAKSKSPSVRRDAKHVIIAQRMSSKGMSLAQIAGTMGIGRSTAHRYVTSSAKGSGPPN